jgi:hypothetical protein
MVFRRFESYEISQANVGTQQNPVMKYIEQTNKPVDELSRQVLKANQDRRANNTLL